jgi:hypothetical protein
MLKKETILTAKEEMVIAMMPKCEVMTAVEMSKSATTRKIRCHPHAAVSPSHTLGSRDLDRCRQ